MHLPAAKEIADHFHAFKQDVVDDIERRVTLKRGLQLVFKANLFAVDDVVLETLFKRLALAGFLRALRFHSLKKPREFDKRIVGANLTCKPALVVNQLASNLQFLFADTIQRFDLAGVHDRCIETGFDGVVQKDGI